jgi:hypothetical protein
MRPTDPTLSLEAAALAATPAEVDQPSSSSVTRVSARWSSPDLLRPRALRRIVNYIAGAPQNKKAQTDELRLSHSNKTVALIAKSSNGEKIFYLYFVRFCASLTVKHHMGE